MKIESFVATDKDDCRDGLIIQVDGVPVFSAFDGEPEDNALSRNFSDCFGITDLMQQAYMAGADKEVLEIEQNKITWDELFEIF